jgi:hypothetical protein
MGVFGKGLYGSDFALDLRSAIAAVAKLPFDGDHLLALMVEAEPEAAENPQDPDHETFWKVIADQFAKRGIQASRVPATLAAAPHRRKTLQKPQPLLLQEGGIYLYPTAAGKCRNPYLRIEKWAPDGWSALVVVECGRLFGYLAWYRYVALCAALPDRPDHDTLLRSDLRWKLARPGTVTAVHCKRLQLQQVGSCLINPDLLAEHFPNRRPPLPYVVQDISIANGMSAEQTESAMLGLASILQPPAER